LHITIVLIIIAGGRNFVSLLMIFKVPLEVIEAKIFWNKLLRFIIGNYVGALINIYSFYIWLHA